jgi:3',5'-cyclic AMP phosphodiesterase CpdA
MPTVQRCTYRIPLIVILLCAAMCAQAQQTAALSPEVEMYRPTVMPDRIVLTWAGDPATTQAVTWRTDTSVKNAVAQIAIADPDPTFKGSDVPATTSELVAKLWPANYHSAKFENLKPDTMYAYRVGDGSPWSEWLQFRTASDKPGPFSFIYLGDAQIGIRSLWSRVIRQALKTAPDARFVAFGGDLATDGSNDALWGELFGVGAGVYGMTSVFPTPGNHEYRKDGAGSSHVTPHWHAQFTLPENGPKGLEEYAYHTDYQGLRMISLASNEKTEEQTAWLEKVLSDNPNKWTIVTFHHPIFSPAQGRSQNKLRAAWMPLFEKYKVDLVLNGHDHTYGRTGVEGATVYLTSVSGAKMYELSKQPWMHRAAENTQLFQVISIDGDKLSLETRTATGSLYDALELTKQAGKVNRLVDKIPAGVPERVRPPKIPAK